MTNDASRASIDVRSGERPMLKRNMAEDFNEAHPPFATDINELPPGRTTSKRVGEAVIAKDNFDYVRDPAYLWQDMPTVTPNEKKQRDAVRAAKTADVERYVVYRERFWERVRRLQFAENVTYEVTTTRGFETSHQETTSKSRTETIGLTLGLELSGTLFKPGAAARSVALSRAGSDTKANSSLQFTYELSNELRFERVDSETYREETNTTLSIEFAGGNVYYVWSLVEELFMLRQRPKTDVLEPIGEIVTATGITWIDRFTYAPPALPARRIHPEA